jgi:nicotinamidase-related amidase
MKGRVPLALDEYMANRTALLLVDPYNDFLSDGGKLWPNVKAVAESVELLQHLRALVEAARRAGIAVFYVPHRRWCEGDYDGWRHPGPWQVLTDRGAVFAEGTWGGDWHPDLVPRPGDVLVEQHWGQNGFAGTDLDVQLKQRGIERIIVIGVGANTCVEATARGGAELGYHVTLVRDATAAFSPDAMHAAHNVNGPSFAHAILTSDAVIAAMATASP